MLRGNNDQITNGYSQDKSKRADRYGNNYKKETRKRVADVANGKEPKKQRR